MRKMGIGLGVGINRSNYAQGIFSAYQSRVVADGGITEAGACVDAVSGLLLNASLLLIPSGYKSGKAYAEIPTNGNADLTWTRASDAWRTNADGLIQRVPWNLSTYSESFDNLAWSKTNATITANSTTAPNGTLTADTIVSIGADGRALQAFNVLENQNYTFSVWLKSTTSSNVNAAIRSAGNASSIVVTPEWQRFTVTQSYPAAATRFPGISGIANNESVFAWGAQLVEGSSAQTYFPTTDRLNVPRLSYMYGSCPALLLEPQRTNLALYSEQFDNAAWTKNATSVTANSTTSPDGTTNADTITIQTIGTATIRQNVTVAANTTYTFSFYALRGTATDLRYSVFNFSGGSDIVSPTSYYAQTNSTTWSRITVTFTTPTGCTSIGIYPTRDATSTGTFFVWGAQLELGAYPTTYIPTTTASATRIADSFSRSNIYTNGLITSSGGTWFVEFKNTIAYIRDTFAQSLFIGTDSANTGGNGFAFTFGGSAAQRPLIRKYVSGVETLIGSLTADNNKIAIKWNGSTADVFINGTKVTSATSFSLTNLTFLGGNGSATPIFIQQMALYPTPLSDTDCTTLTTL